MGFVRKMSNNNFKYVELKREFERCQRIIHRFCDFDTAADNELTFGDLENNSNQVVSLMQSHPSCIEYTRNSCFPSISPFLDDKSRKDMKLFAVRIVNIFRHHEVWKNLDVLRIIHGKCKLNVFVMPQGNREIEAIYHLIESHAVLLRLQVQHRWSKTEERQNLLQQPQTFGLNPVYTKFNSSTNPKDCVPDIKNRLSEFPKEWYMVQLTTQYTPSTTSIYDTSDNTGMLPIHISVLPSGEVGIDPFCVTVPKPKISTNYDVCREIRDILSNNRLDLEASYANNQLYWKMRERQDKRMKAAIHELEVTWLREWRVLLIADPIEELDLINDLHEMIDKLIADKRSMIQVSGRTRWLLHKIALGACFLTRKEIALAVKYILPDDEKFSDNVILSIYGKLGCLTPLRTAKRKTLVLIIDENLDHIPFEIMNVLQNHPVTRFPSLHMAYALYKEHEGSIENGCKIIEIGKNNGSFIVNPSGNLPELEKRMKLFIDYWLPHWSGTYNVRPDEKSFESALTNYDILMYNGHGSGIQFLSGERIEKLRVKAMVLLFGCGSARLMPVGGRFPPIGVSNQYLIACSPCILGMLWEVTDCDVDKLTANFIANWIPSPAPRPWSDVNIQKWSNGSFEFKDFNLEDGLSTMAISDVQICETSVEPEMLRALAKSRGICSQYMTMAAVVIRGLPIRLK